MHFYTARQPILNRRQRVVAYELLFRDSYKNCFPVDVPDKVATAKLLVNSFLSMDIEDMTDGKPALINFPTSLLKEHLVHILPYKNLVIEVLETVEPNDDNFAILKQLFDSGYHLALDDFIYSPAWDRFLPLFKLIKIDIVATPLDTIAHILPKLKQKKTRLLAEKVETQADFLHAKALGFDYFQGYFFYKPEIVKGNEVELSQPFLMSIYTEVMKPSFSYRKLEAYFTQDMDLSYKLLRFVNSSYFSHVKDIISLKQAMIFLGENQLRKFVCLIVMAQLNPDKPQILIQNTMLRARLCEVIAKVMKLNKLADAAFLTGLFSTLDAILDKPMEKVLHSLPLAPEINNALLHQQGELAECLALAIAYMQGNWEFVSEFVSRNHINAGELTRRCNQVYLWLSEYQRSSSSKA
ncbi:signal transduction protein [Shewanella denitrificans OS217]|jgi:c-di-GMP phosphodiesterase|uniref:Signal transduction protein n=1 Tax=Shewanella denitrificans (strain OS217 / ATCC BAA-1090 / DSM 15013) TaxID=318161 RepID=Q12SE2_SHEDO|nr:HDOD domain-containing protein [Shewanella denitrificans]ABE53634.1 signal transduction protein [Shewanella denitrificans OS217]